MGGGPSRSDRHPCTRLETVLRRLTRAAARSPRLALVTGGLLGAIVVGGCDWSGRPLGPTPPSTTPSVVPAASSTSLLEPSEPPTSSLEPSEAPSSGGTWGPLAVVPPQDGTDTARAEGTLRITDACVFLARTGGPVLLVWLADRTTWDAQDRTIAFANFDGSTVTVSDGTRVVLTGGGDSSDESGTTAEEWLARTQWIARPAASCPLDSRWWVGGVER